MQQFVECEQRTSKEAAWLLCDEVRLYLASGNYSVPTLKNPSMHESKTKDSLPPISKLIHTRLEANLAERNGVLPTLSELITALLAPHTRELMLRTIQRRRGAKALIEEAWKVIETDLIDVHVALLRQDHDAKRPRESDSDEDKPDEEGTEAGAATEEVELLGARPLLGGGAFNITSPKAVFASTAATPARRSVLDEAKQLAKSELHKWRTIEAELELPLMPRKVVIKDPKTKKGTEVLLEPPDVIEFWMSPSRQATYRGLRIVACTYLIVDATAARSERTFSWSGIVDVAKRANLKSENLCDMIYCKRNAHYAPTRDEIVQYILTLKKQKSVSESK